jgi:hypothetical protein
MKRMTATSLIANATTDKPTKAALIYRYICENKAANYKQIASALHTSIATVTARINDLLYIHQQIKVSFIRDNMAHYTVREATDPENKRPLSDAEIWHLVATIYLCELLYPNDNDKARAHALRDFKMMKEVSV